MSASASTTPLSQLVAPPRRAGGALARAAGACRCRRADAAVEDPDWISFACVLVRAAVIESAGGFDEGYFLYYEDVDLLPRGPARGLAASASCPRRACCTSTVRARRCPSASARRARAPGYLYDARARWFTKAYGRAGCSPRTCCGRSDGSSHSRASASAPDAPRRPVRVARHLARPARARRPG